MRMAALFSASEPVVIGSYEFTAERIVEFAREFDPHFFHVDAEKAKQSLFGGLCASGWHICAAAMKCSSAYIAGENTRILDSGETPPKLGPSPGVRNLKWLKPVFAGDTITYSMLINAEASSSNHPDRRLCELTYEGVNQHGERVMRFDCSVVELN